MKRKLKYTGIKHKGKRVYTGLGNYDYMFGDKSFAMTSTYFDYLKSQKRKRR